MQSQSSTGAGALSPMVRMQEILDGNLLQPPTSRKRERDELNEETNHRNHVESHEEDEIIRTSKRTRRSRMRASSAVRPECLVIHRVQCEGGETHSRHKQVSHFTDVPRLFAGDSKAS